MGDVFFGAELGGDVAEVDLHGMNKIDASDALEQGVQSAFMQKEQVIRVIHGRGNGVLRDMVKTTLARHPNVVSIKVDDGVTYAEIEQR